MAEYCVETPLGLATLSLVNVELDVEFSPARSTGPAVRGDRALVRSTVPGQADLWAVFERAGCKSGWTQVTADLTADQIADWARHRAAVGSKSRTFDEWLGSEVQSLVGAQS